VDVSKPDPCGAKLVHSHGVAVCDVRGGHEMHSAWCDSCYEDGYDDSLDRLEWERDGEDWTTR